MAPRRTPPLLLGVPSLLLALVTVMADTGCQKQAEGARCDVLNRNDDCDDGLECVAAKLLLNDVADRCCPPEDEVSAENDCRRRVTIGSGSGTGGTGSPSGTGGGGPTAGAPSSEGGAAAAGGATGSAGSCSYPSDCPLGQTCGPRGVCQPECREDRDCGPGGWTCSDAGVCQATTGAAGAPATGGAAATAGGGA